MKPGAWSNPKVVDLAMRIGGLGLAAGLLECLWRVTGEADNSQGVAPWRRVEQLLGPGFCRAVKPEAALAALVVAEIVELEDSGKVRVLGWRDHRPDYLRKREMEAERLKKKRGSSPDVGAKLDQPGPTGPKLGHVASSPSPSPSLSPCMEQGSASQSLSGKEPDPCVDPELDSLAQTLCERLNTAIGSRYRPASKTLRRELSGRLRGDGHTAEDIMAVVDAKIDEWQDSRKMRRYLRPATLLNRTNFENYVGQLGAHDDYRTVIVTSPDGSSRKVGDHE